MGAAVFSTVDVPDSQLVEGTITPLSPSATAWTVTKTSGTPEDFLYWSGGSIDTGAGPTDLAGLTGAQCTPITSPSYPGGYKVECGYSSNAYYGGMLLEVAGWAGTPIKVSFNGTSTMGSSHGDFDELTLEVNGSSNAVALSGMVNDFSLHPLKLTVTCDPDAGTVTAQLASSDGLTLSPVATRSASPVAGQLTGIEAEFVQYSYDRIGPFVVTTLDGGGPVAQPFWTQFANAYEIP